MTPLEILNIKLPDESITPQRRQLAIEEIEREIKSYCNLDTVPEALHYTWANMAAELLRYRPQEEKAGRVSSITEGDTAVSFATEDANARLDDLLLNYREQLQAYRKVVFS